MKHIIIRRAAADAAALAAMFGMMYAAGYGMSVLLRVFGVA